MASPEFLGGGDDMSVKIGVKVDLGGNAASGLKDLAGTAKITAGELRRVVAEQARIRENDKQKIRVEVDADSLPTITNLAREAEQQRQQQRSRAEPIRYEPIRPATAEPIGRQTSPTTPGPVAIAGVPTLRVETPAPLEVAAPSSIPVTLGPLWQQLDPEAVSRRSAPASAPAAMAEPKGLWSALTSFGSKLIDWLSGRWRSMFGGVGFSTGGVVGSGGPCYAYGPRGTDTIPAWLTRDEHVVNADSARANRPLLERINAAKGPLRMAGGGEVPWYLDHGGPTESAEKALARTSNQAIIARLKRAGLSERGQSFKDFYGRWQEAVNHAVTDPQERNLFNAFYALNSFKAPDQLVIQRSVEFLKRYRETKSLNVKTYEDIVRRLGLHSQRIPLVQTLLDAHGRGEDVSKAFMKLRKRGEYVSAVMGNPQGVAVDEHVTQVALGAKTAENLSGVYKKLVPEKQYDRVKGLVIKAAEKLGMEPRALQAAAFAYHINQKLDLEGRLQHLKALHEAFGGFVPRYLDHGGQVRHLGLGGWLGRLFGSKQVEPVKAPDPVTVAPLKAAPVAVDPRQKSHDAIRSLVAGSFGAAASGQGGNLEVEHAGRTIRLGVDYDRKTVGIEFAQTPVADQSPKARKRTEFDSTARLYSKIMTAAGFERAEDGRWLPQQPPEHLAAGGIVGRLKQGLESRYGRAGALAILASGQAAGWGATAIGAALGLPLLVPGQSVVGMLPGLAVAEVVRWLRGHKPAAAAQEPLPAMNEARRFLEPVNEGPPRFAHGGPARYLASGGRASSHPGQPRGTDQIPAWLSEGEYVVNAASATANRGLVEKIDRARGPVHLKTGGPASKRYRARKHGVPVGHVDVAQAEELRPEEYEDDAPVNRNPLQQTRVHLAREFFKQQAAARTASAADATTTLAPSAGPKSPTPMPDSGPMKVEIVAPFPLPVTFREGSGPGGGVGGGKLQELPRKGGRSPGMAIAEAMLGQGPTGAVTAPVMAGVAAAKAVMGFADKVASLTDIWGNDFVPTNLKVIKTLESIPLVGDIIGKIPRHLAESLSGTREQKFAMNTFAHLTQGIPFLGDMAKVAAHPYNQIPEDQLTKSIPQRRREWEIERNEIETSEIGQGHSRQQFFPLEMMRAANVARVQAFARHPGPEFKRDFEMAHKKPWEFRRYEETVPLQRHTAAAQREVLAAQAGKQAAVKNLSDVSLVHESAKARHQQLQERVEAYQHYSRESQKGPTTAINPYGGMTRIEGLEQYKKDLADLGSVTRIATSLAEERNAADRRVTEASGQLATAMQQARQAQINELQQKVSKAVENQGRAEAATQGIADLRPSERQFALQSIDMLKKHGYDATTDEQRSLIQRVGGDRLLHEFKQKAAEADPTYKKLREAVGEDTLRDSVEKALKVKGEFDAKITVDVRQTAKEKEEALTGDQLEGMKKEALDALMKKIYEHTRGMHEKHANE